LRTEVVDRGSITDVVTAVGTLRPLAVTLVGSQLSGQVSEVLVDVNDSVRHGQLLARLDEQSFRTRVREAEAELEVARAQLLIQQGNLEKAQARLAIDRARWTVLEAEAASAAAEQRRAEGELGRVRSLAARATAAQSELEKAETAFDSAQALRRAADARLQVQDAEIRAAASEVTIAEAQVSNVRALIRQRQAALEDTRLNLERTAIRSPLDGVVIRRDIEPGQTVVVSLQAPTLFSLAGDLRSMRVEARVDEADIGRVRVAQAVEFRVDAYPGRRFPGRVSKIHMAPETLQNVVTYTVVVDAPNSELLLLPGMTALVQISVANYTDALRVPNAALRFSAPPDWGPARPPPTGQSRVWVLERGQPTPVDLVLGPSDDSYTLIQQGPVEVGDRIAVGWTEP